MPKDRPDAPNAGVLDAPNAGALNATNAGELDAPKAGALAPKLGMLLADPKPPKPLEAAPKGEAAVEPKAGADPNPAKRNVSRHP
jgi:hypothetical protein